MRKVDYNEWAEYINSLSLYSRREIASVLEIAAGNCRIADIIADRYDFFVATDISFQMLNCSGKNNYHKVACDMRELPFNFQFDFIYATFDSLNYILSKEELLRFFMNIQNFMHSDSYFTFDVSLEKNSLKHERKLNRKGKVNGLSFTQISRYDKYAKIHTNRFIIKDRNENIVEEIHKQRIYELMEIFEIIENSGMFVMECFDAFSFDDADMNSERAQFLIKKAQNADD
jgi:hypothetical protein